MRRLILLTFTAAVFGCATGGAEPRQTSPVGASAARPQTPVAATHESGKARSPLCAGWQSETAVGVESVSSGAALVFTTRTGDLVRLRAHVANLPETTLPKGDAHLDNVSGGIRIVFRSSDPAGLEPLRKSVRDEARELATTCGLSLDLSDDESSSGPGGAPPATPTMITPALPTPSGDSKDDAKPKETRKEDEPKNGDKSDGDKPKNGDKSDGDDSKNGDDSDGDEPKNGDKPKDGDKPKNGDKPKDGDKPKNGDKPKEKPEPPFQL